MNPGCEPQAGNTAERLVAVHAGVFLTVACWAFGGNADWVRTPLSLFGTLGIVLSAVIAAYPPLRRVAPRGALGWAAPVLVLNLLVAAACLTPQLRPLSIGGTAYLVPLANPWWRPGSADPATSLRSLWLFDGIYFSCLNLALAVRRRGLYRLLLGWAVANAAVLAVFGTVQKFFGSKGIYFGAVKSPQQYFFASFVYKNHWGAFVLLMSAASAGLVLRYARGMNQRGFFHGPATLFLVMTLVLALSVPVSGSRACSLLLVFLLLAALVQGLPRVSNAMGVHGLGRRASGAVLALGGVAALLGAWAFGADAVTSRTETTRDELRVMWASGKVGWRNVLYRDTLQMARDRPVFGWGMGSYPTVFRFYNTQKPGDDRVPVVFHDAHSDWLQSVSEIGLVGTALIGAAVALPLSALRGRRLAPLPRFLLLGCATVAAYATVEFPFGNVAVVLSWWFCFFIAVQYGRLTSTADSFER